jgi:RNA polymerase sigma factor (sigma-70 family)
VRPTGDRRRVRAIGARGEPADERSNTPTQTTAAGTTVTGETMTQPSYDPARTDLPDLAVRAIEDDSDELTSDDDVPVTPAMPLAEQLRAVMPRFGEATLRGISTAEYHERNFELFRVRDRARDELAELDRKARTETLDTSERVRRRRLERQLDRVLEELVSFNYGLVVKIVRKFSSRKSADDSADFEQAGVVGLMRAIHKYEVERGAKFSSFAHIQILGEVLRSVRFNDFANMNQVDFDSRLTILKTQELLSTEFPNGATYEQIAEAAGLNVTQVARVLNPPRMQSIHTPVGEDGDTELGDLLPDAAVSPESEVLTRMAIEQLQKHGLSILNERELFVLGRRFGLDGEPRQNLQQLGDMLGLSREAVRQQEMKALAKLNHPSVLFHMLVSER